MEIFRSSAKKQPQNLRKLSTQINLIRKMMGKPLGWRAPSCSTPCWSPSKGNTPDKYQLYKVYMGSTIKGTIPRGPHHFPYESPLLVEIFICSMWSKMPSPATYHGASNKAPHRAASWHRNCRPQKRPVLRMGFHTLG